MVVAPVVLGPTGSGHAADGAGPMRPGTVPLDIRKIATLLWLATAVVVGLGLLREVVVHLAGTGTVLKDLRHFALDSEHSLPAWYESLTMAAASGLLAIVATLSRHHDPRNRLPWTMLAVIFLFMSIDEAVSFHEVTITPLRNALKLTDYLYFSWVVIAAPVLLVLAVYFLPFILRLPRRTAVRFVIAGGLFVSGAFGLELVGGHYVSIGGFEYLPYKIAAACEETLEIVGMTLFVTSLFQHLAESVTVLNITMQHGR